MTKSIEASVDASPSAVKLGETNAPLQISDVQLLGSPWLIGLATLLLPSYIMLAQRVWANDEQGHGPIILGVTLWLSWQRRDVLQRILPKPATLAGGLCLLLGLTGYTVGRSQYVDTLEILSHIPILAGVLLLTKGRQGITWGAFYLFFLLFMIPLPGALVQAITTPLKILVSHSAEILMGAAGYPISRTGVILYIGQYQLLVADACAGLNSMFTLEAIGLLYMNIMNHTSVKRNATLATLVIPIAFIANVTRVIMLILVTYYFGDETGQGFVHSFAGMLLFTVALTLLISVDGLLGKIFKQAPTDVRSNLGATA